MIGASLSAAFTVMAAHAGADGNVAEQVQDFITIAGATLSFFCGIAGIAIGFFRLFERLAQRLIAFGERVCSFRLPRVAHAAKFIKIFMP
jgi:hypothetical protein